MRNQVSALQSRIKKKQEVKFLNQLITCKDKKVKKMMEILVKHISAEDPQLLIEIGQEFF